MKNLKTFRKRYLIYSITLVFLIGTSCNKETLESDLAQWKEEILQTEKDFSEMAGREGIPKAFLYYAAEDAVLMRNNKLIIGKEAIRLRYHDVAGDPSKATLSWKPDFVQVSASGDLGYTYGKYLYKTTDSLGNQISDKGVFHTVWKRQADGSWKFVWD